MLDSDDHDDLLGGGDSRATEAPSAVPAPLPYELNESALAGLLRLSLGVVRSKARDGVFIRTRPAHFDVTQSVGNYVEALRKSATGRPSATGDLAAEKLRLTKAQADAQELKNRISSGELVAIADVRNEWVTVATDLRAQILAIPNRVSARVGLGREAVISPT